MEQLTGKIIATARFAVPRVTNARYRQPLIACVLLAPITLIFILFWAWPILQSILFSLQNWRSAPPTFDPTFNWHRLAFDPLFGAALGHTLELLIIQVPLMILLALAIAMSINSRQLRCRGLFQFAFFAPVVVSEVGYSAVFRLLCNTDYGAHSGLLGVFTSPGQWLNSTTGAKVVVLLAVTWRWTGYNALLLLTGLRGIPNSMYESATLDGVSPRRQFLHITLPLLKPVIAFAVAMSIFGSLQLFVEPQLITRTGPAGATATLGTYLYQQGFRNFNFGYAAAIGYAAALISVSVSLLQLHMMTRR